MLFAILMATAVALPAVAVDNGTLGIRPANESDFFHLSLAPGATAETAAIVSNHSNATVKLSIYPVDATNTSTGGFAFGGQQDPRKSVGSWSSLATSSITVEAKSELRVPITVAVPAGTVSGDYAGGVIIESAPVLGASSPSNSGGAVTRIDVIQRQGVRIYLRVGGTAVGKLAPASLSWTTRGSVVDFALPITNTGTTILHPKATLKLTSSIGSPATNLVFTTPQSLLPGTSVVMHARWKTVPVLEFATLRATLTSETATQNVTSTFILVSWWIIGLIVLGAALLGFGSWRTVRYVRRSREAFRTLAGMKVAESSNKE